MVIDVGWMPLVADHVTGSNWLAVDGKKLPLVIIGKRRTLFATVIGKLANVVPTGLDCEIGFGTC